MHLKKIKFIILLLLFFTLQSNLFHGQCKQQGKILVCGFESRLINDLQDRLLRETVLREFHKQGYQIISVMNFESIFYNESVKFIRKLSSDELKSYCKEFKTDYAISGKISVKGNDQRVKKIKQGKTYHCEITLYIKEKDKFYKMSLDAKGTTDLYDFYNHLSKKIVSGVSEIVNK